MTNEELTAIYNDANGLDPKRHNPITTERIFSAMRAAMAKQRMACADEIERLSGETYAVVLCEHKEAADWLRSNASLTGAAPAGEASE